MHMEDAVDADVYGFLPNHARHVDKAANAYSDPSHGMDRSVRHPVEIYAYPKGVVGKAELWRRRKKHMQVCEPSVITWSNYTTTS